MIGDCSSMIDEIYKEKYNPNDKNSGNNKRLYNDK